MLQNNHCFLCINVSKLGSNIVTAIHISFSTSNAYRYLDSNTATAENLTSYKYDIVNDIKIYTKFIFKFRKWLVMHFILFVPLDTFIY